MPYADPETRRACSARWYALNKARHISNVLARRAGKLPINHRNPDPGSPLPVAFEERLAIAVTLMRRWNPALFDRFRDDLRQEAAIVALENPSSFGDLSRAAARAAWKLRKEIA